MLVIAIDGACRRNGKPDCTASGGVFIQYLDDSNNRTACNVHSVYEYCSTNQRGELLALLKALETVCEAKQEAMIITDSEYLFNAMTREWYVNWQHNGWITRDGLQVKNMDIWREIVRFVDLCRASGIELSFFHIKGHCIPFGRVSADKALSMDPSGALLLSLVSKRYDEIAPTKQKVLDAAQELSYRNNGYVLDASTLKRFVVANVVADAIATKVVDAADKQS